MSHKSRAVTVTLALAVGLCIPASIAMSPSEPRPDASSIELVPVSEPIPTPSESTPVETTPVQPSENPSPSSEALTEPPTPVQPVVTDMPEDLTDTRPMEEWEAESAPWEWSQLLPDEAYHWGRCDNFYQTDCVWIASEHKVQGAAESFLSLPDGDVIPLNEEQARALAG